MFNKLKSITNGLWRKPFLHAVQAVYVQFGGRDDEEAIEIRRAIAGLIREITGMEGEPEPEDCEAIRALLKDRPAREAEQMIAMLGEAPAISPARAAETLKKLPEESRFRVLSELLQLAVGAGRLTENRDFLRQLAEKLGISEERFESLEKDLAGRHSRRRKIIRSGAGIGAALIIIVIFILTATLLRSVIFGLIAAYILLPVEKFFERRLSDEKSILYKLSRFSSKLAEPLRRLSFRVRHLPEPQLSAAEKAAREQKNRIAKAVSLTCAVLLIAFVFLATLVSLWSMNYFGRLTDSVRARAAVARMARNADSAGTPPAPQTVKATEDGREIATEAEPAAPTMKEPGGKMTNSGSGTRYLETALAPLLNRIDDLRDRLDRVPFVQYALSELSKALNDEATQAELMKMFLKQTGGIFAFLAGLVGSLVTILLDILLTIFFFLLFLTKIAQFTAGSASPSRQSEYLVRTVFNGSWLPGAGEETVAEAERIISEIIRKLKVWLKGYLTLVLIDTTIYTTAFYFLRVPYFFILGPLAGCGVLLPYIGPIASAILTLAVTIAVGGSSVTALQLLGIVLVYLIHNGIIEQFIFYPMVIGESLGLTTLETIIVVLLGAIFAGITGMILAVPTASVIKYLVPQIYHCFDRRNGGD